MTTLLTCLTVALWALLLGGGFRMAIWAWRKLGITVFAWFLAIRLTQVFVSLIGTFDTDPALLSRIDSALKTLKENPALDPTDVYLLWLPAGAFFTLLSTTALFSLAAVETAQIATRLQPGWQPPTVVRMAHRLRHGLGLLAVLAVVTPPLALHLWLSLGTP